MLESALLSEFQFLKEKGTSVKPPALPTSTSLANMYTKAVPNYKIITTDVFRHDEEKKMVPKVDFKLLHGTLKFMVVKLVGDEKTHVQQRINELDKIEASTTDKQRRKREFAEGLILVGYRLSGDTWEKYRTEFISYKSKKRVVEKLYRSCKKSPTVEKTVDRSKQNNLLKCISMAIRVGLNYQELERFKPTHIPETEEMTLDDVRKLVKTTERDTGVYPLPNRTVSEGDMHMVNVSDPVVQKMVNVEGGLSHISVAELGLKKVRVSVLQTDPYWEGIEFTSDLGEYVSVWHLKNQTYVQYINPTKRNTLRIIHSVFPDYTVNLDTTPPKKLKKLCALKTLQKAPFLHAEVCTFFETGGGDLETYFKDWQESDRSYKYLKGEETESDPYIVAEDVEAEVDGTLEDVLNGDFRHLVNLINSQIPDDYAISCVRNAVQTTDTPSDMAFARDLSDAFVKLGFLPEGCELYCGVTPELPHGEKREGNTNASPKKRQRTKLFSPLVYSKC